MVKFKIPKEIKDISGKLKKAGFKAYLVGGCVRDSLIGRDINDWDVATDAVPKEIQKIFPDNVYENTFGTVAVKTSSKDRSLKVVEVTTFRLEGGYSDKRHPDEVKFAKTIEEDLSRRDFTINAIAYDLDSGELVDPYHGEKDLKKKLIQAVGDPSERFNEDALRLMRAVRLATQLGFSARGGPASGWEIEKETKKAVKKNSGMLEFIAKERIREELTKLIMAQKPHEGIIAMQELGMLRHVMPELEQGVGVGQNKHHIFTVFEHNVKALEYAASKDFPLDIRIASLLHDVGKPKTKKGEGHDSTFYGHQVVGERMALKILDRLHFPKKLVEKVALLVREHMFVYDPETVTLSGVRRLLRRVGKENVDDLFKVREADRIGSGVPKAQPYRLRYLKAMVEKVQKDPVAPKMLKLKGDVLMEVLKIEPGPKIGKILSVLLEEVLDTPEMNTEAKLKKRAKELGELTDKELDALALKAKKAATRAQDRIDGELKKKYFVK